MAHTRRDQLIALGSEVLADHILALAVSNPGAAHLVHCLTTSPELLMASFKSKLAELKEEGDWIDWDDTEAFVDRLQLLVYELKASSISPELGLQLVTEFFLSDVSIMERCDDPCGEVGDVFTDSLTHLFHAYAKEVNDRERLLDTMIELVEGDQYGVRLRLVDYAHESLDHDEMKRMVIRLEKDSEEAGTAEARYPKNQMIISLCRQIGDAECYEHTYLNTYGRLTENALMELARMKCNERAYESAMGYLNQIPAGYNRGRNALLREIHDHLGNREAVIDLLKEEFRYSGSVTDFEVLVSYAGEAVRDPLLQAEIARIEAHGVLTIRNLSMLMDFSFFKEAEQYLMKRAAQIDGEDYFTYVSIAQKLYYAECYRASTLIYRRLIESILKRGYSRAYHHGVDYLRILDFIAPLVDQWEMLQEHTRFKEALYGAYKSKYSFWNQYEAAKRTSMTDVTNLFVPDYD